MEPKDPREMRKEMHAALRYSGWAQNPKPALSTSSGILIRMAYNTALHLGLSGEDEMTILAYHALLQLEKMTDLALQDSYLRINPLMWTPQAQDGAADSPSPT
jgi:hypothetical protein